MGLTLKQGRFCQEYLVTGNASKAYRTTYDAARMKPETVMKRASELLRHNREVAGRVSVLRHAASDRAELKASDILNEIKRLAFSDIAGIMHADGRVKLPHELDPATRAAVASFEIDEYGKVKYKFWDKNAALERAAKILGLFEKDNSQKVDALSELLGRLSGNVLGVSKDAALDAVDAGSDNPAGSVFRIANA